jgi:GDP-4-dehydro-6-deoxy-D-mannose reductase
MTRSFNHVGAGHADTFAIPSFCRQIAEIAAGRREPVLSVGNLSARRDYIDVRDVCRAYADLAEKGASGETYNIGSGRAVSLREIVGMIAGFSGRSVEIRVDPEKLRPLDAPIIEADIGKITALTGWKPAIPLEQALREVYDYYVAKVAAD